MLWLPLILVQLFTNWYWCSFSISGQLQRDGSRPSPKSVNPVFLLSPLSHLNAGKPPVDVSAVFSPFTPNASAAATFASRFTHSHLILNHPNLTSLSRV